MIPLKDDTPSALKPYVTGLVDRPVLRGVLLLLLWFAVQLVSDLALQDGGASVAFRAHIGGFLAGMLLAPLLKRREVALFAP